MVGLLDPRYQSFDLGSSASVIATRAAMAEQAAENLEGEQKAAWEKLPQNVKDRIILNVKLQMARKAIMNGPRGTPPRPSTLLRFIRQIAKGTPPDKAGYLTMGERYLHPTKGWRGSVKKKSAA